MKSILVITSSVDATADYVIENYQDKAEFYRINVDDFLKYRINVCEANQWTIYSPDWTIEKASIDGIYYRKPVLPDLSMYEADYQGMIARDIISIINGIVDNFEGKVLTKPYILRKTENKTFQLLYASHEGLHLPKSYIGNSKDSAIKTINNQKSVIKPLTTGKVKKSDSVEIYQTNYIDDLTEDISLTPLYIQNYIEKNYEVRLTCIDNKVFAVRIDSKDKLDWRKDYSSLKYSVIECPQNIKKLCLKLMEDFDLKFGAFDFIVTQNNEWIFLEVNPNGQWLWLEKAVDIPISSAIIQYLIDGHTTTGEYLMEIIKVVINKLLWLWSHFPVLCLSDDYNFATFKWQDKEIKTHLRLSLLNIMLGDTIVYIFSYDISEKKISFMKILRLTDIEGNTLSDKTINQTQNRFRSHVEKLSDEDLEIEKEKLLYHIEQEEQRINTSVEKINIYTTIILTVIPILAALIDFDELNDILITWKLMIGMAAYSLFNICIYIFRIIKVSDISKSSFRDLRESSNRKTEIVVQYQYDWQQLKYKAQRFVGMVSNLQEWAVFLLILIVCIFFGTIV